MCCLTCWVHSNVRKLFPVMKSTYPLKTKQNMKNVCKLLPDECHSFFSLAINIFFAFAHYQSEVSPKCVGLMLGEAHFLQILAAMCTVHSPAAVCTVWSWYSPPCRQTFVDFRGTILMSQVRRGEANSPTAEFAHSMTQSSDFLSSAVNTALLYQPSCPTLS